MTTSPESDLADSPGRRPILEGPAGAAAPYLSRCLREMVRFFRHSAVGRRCTGHIHNLNTPLQVISFQLELLEQKALEEGALLDAVSDPQASRLRTLHHYRTQKLEHLRREVDRIRAMLHQLALQALHEDAEDYTYLDLNQLFQEELELYLAQPFFKHRLAKEFHFSPGLPPIYGHYIDFSQSFRHLVDNALEAMADSPQRRLTVKTSRQAGARLLEIGDTGVGVPPEVLPHLFEPFVTTKGSEAKPRAGLGLFLSRWMVAAYGGEITIASVPGNTWVKVRWPMT